MVTSKEIANISVVVITGDPYFLFSVKGLLGRSRGIRIHHVYDSLANFKATELAAHSVFHAVVCDFDSIAYVPDFYDSLGMLVDEMPGVHFLGLAEGNLAHTVLLAETIHLHALLSKKDLSYCLHLAIHAVANKKASLVSESVKRLLSPGSHLATNSLVLGPHKEHPALSARLAEIVLWRIFVGLDNADIQDELQLEHDTVRTYVSKAYKALGVGDELGAFEALSDWWWITRFAKIV